MEVLDLLNPGKSPDMAPVLVAPAGELGKVLEGLESVLVRGLVHRVWAAHSPRPIGPEKWPQCGIGASSAEPDLEPVEALNG